MLFTEKSNIQMWAGKGTAILEKIATSRQRYHIKQIKIRLPTKQCQATNYSTLCSTSDLIFREDVVFKYDGVYEKLY